MPGSVNSFLKINVEGIVRRIEGVDKIGDVKVKKKLGRVILNDRETYEQAKTLQ